MSTTHTIDEALAKFELVEGSGDGAVRACVMTAISWIAGEAWSDMPACAHPILSRMAIAANDHDDTTPEDRAAILRAGETGLIGTADMPDTAVVWCLAQAPVDASPVERCLAVLDAVSAWREEPQDANLSRANLSRAYLSDANLTDADLSGACVSSGASWLPAGWRRGSSGRVEAVS